MKSKVNSEYAKAIFDLNNELKKIKEVNFNEDGLEKYEKMRNEKAEIYSNFIQNYLMPKSLWSERFQTESGMSLGNIEIASKLYKEKIYHFCYTQNSQKDVDFFGLNIENQPKLLESYIPFMWFDSCKVLLDKNCYALTKSLDRLKYPHNQLNECLSDYKQWSSTPVPVEIIKKFREMEKLYWKIKAAENYLEKWLECLKEAKDPEFICQNIEDRLGHNLSNKKLWKLYIEYLRENEPKEMLQVYSKYCRFFLDDFEMFEEYKNATEKYGPVDVPWKNPFEFECHAPLKIIPQMHEDNQSQFFLPSVDFPFSFDFSKYSNIIKHQFWSLPRPLIKHIVDKADSFIYGRLQQTCKYFFAKNPKLFCHRFYYSNRIEEPNMKFKGQSLLLGDNSPLSLLRPYKNKKLVLTTSLDLSHCKPSTFVSELIKNYIYICEIQFLTIEDQTFTQQELTFLVGSGKVEEFELFNSRVINEKRIDLFLDEYIKMLPNVRKFQLFPLNVLQMAFPISKNKFNYKLKSFHIREVNFEIDAFDFCNFLKQNAAPLCDFSIIFNEQFQNRALASQLTKCGELLIKQWKPLEQKPFRLNVYQL